MPEGAMRFPGDPATLVSAAELAKVIGADVETINNWLRRGIITRARIGGRHLRSRLFSTEEVYKAALTNELVKLGLAPSSANEAVNELWERWDKREVEGRKIYAVILPSNNKWSVLLCWQKLSGGPLCKFGRRTQSIQEMELPKQAFAMIAISDVFDRITTKLSEWLSENT
jgi:MerR HTH family regulatory protein